MEFDKAILRPGRMFACFKLKPLVYDQALKIWIDEGLNKEDFPFDSDNILQAH
jgi:hypothetical protein